MTLFSSALVFPQWQGAGSRKGYAAGTALLEQLIPDDLPRAWVHCADDDVTLEDGVKGLGDLVAQAETAQHLLSQLPPGPILTVGGDCAADLVPIAHANHREDGRMALVYLDAHADLNAPAESPSGHFHGMVVRTLLGDGPAPLVSLLRTPIASRQVFYVSARERDPAEDMTIAARQIFRLTDGEPVARLITALQQRNVTHLYLHLDLDILDPEAFPFIGVPAARGWSVRDLADCLATLRGAFEIAGAALTELNLASADAADIATPALLHILRHGLGLQGAGSARNTG